LRTAYDFQKYLKCSPSDLKYRLFSKRRLGHSVIAAFDVLQHQHHARRDCDVRRLLLEQAGPQRGAKVAVCADLPVDAASTRRGLVAKVRTQSHARSVEAQKQ
jgi:hypothetical protein